MAVVVNVALPVFAIIFLGVIAGKTRLLGDASSEALNRFVYWFALPPVLFLSMAGAPIEAILYWPYVASFLGAILIVWLATSLVAAVSGSEAGGVAIMQGMSATFPNTGYMGIPLFLAAFGEPGLVAASIGTVITSVISMGIAITGLELLGADQRGVARALRDVAAALVGNPLILSAAAGVAWSASAAPDLPEAIIRFLNLLGAAASPAALFAIGLFIGTHPVRGGLAEIGWLAGVKLLALPLAAWILAEALGLAPFWAMSSVLMAALPTGALTFVVAQRYGIYVQRTSAVILVSTILSVVTLSALLLYYGPDFPSP